MVLAVEPLAASTARAEEPETLWETLNKVERNSGKNGMDPDEPQRIPLGPVPGFTVPSLDRVGTNSDTSKSKKKVYRGALAPLNRLWDNFLSSTGSKVDTRGDATVTFQANSISGGSQAASTYNTANYVGEGSNGVYTTANLNVDATMFKYFHYNTVISNSPYRSPNQNHVKLDYNTKKTRLQVGDINVNFSGNSLISFSRYLSGIELDNEWSPKLKTKMLYSQTKAETKTISTAGNNTSGPYFLFSGQIVDGSAQLRIDNRDMQQGKDYTLDPNTGELNFLNGIVVLQSQTIALTYEAQGYNNNAGTIWGVRSQFNLTPINNFGITYVTQQTPKVTTYSSRTQQFQGQPTALAAYTLDLPIDTTKPYTVTVGGVPLVAGSATAGTGEYFIDPSFPNVIRLRTPVTNQANVNISYYPKDTTPNAGSRNVLGLDGHVGLGRIGSLTIEAAASGLSLSSNSYLGKAAQIRADLTPTRNLTTHLTIKDIGAAYSPIQSPGFNRSEKSIELAGDYNPVKRLHLNFEAMYAKRPTYTYSSSTATATTNVTATSLGNDTYRQYTLGGSYDLSKEARLNLSRNYNSTAYLVGGTSDSTNDNLSLTWSHRQISLDLGLLHNLNNTNSPNGYLATGTTTGTPYSSNSATTTERASLQWRALKWLSLESSLSENAIHNSGSAYTGTVPVTNAVSEQFSMRINPPLGKRLAKWGKNISFIYTLGISDSGSNGNTTTTTTGTTTTTTPTTGVGGTGVVSTRNLFAPWVSVPGRDSSSFGTTSSSAAGGGANYNLGSAGNYSGYLGNSFSNVGVTSIAGRTTTNHLGMTYVLANAMNLNVAYDVADSTGNYQYNSNRKGANANLSWTPSDRLQMTAGFNILRVNYTGGQGSTRTDTMQFSFVGRPFRNGITTTLSYQSTLTNSNLNLSTTSSSIISGTATPSTPLTTSTTNNNSNLNQLAARIDVPISSRHTLFVDWVNATTTGTLGNKQTDLRFGMDIYMTQFLKFTLGWQSINQINTDTSQSNYNYHTNSLLAQFGLHF